MRFIALLVSLAAGGGVGWIVFRELSEVFADRIPLAGGAVSGAVVFALLYFPLLRPLADIVQDRLGALANRVRHRQAGSGLGDVPERIARGNDGPGMSRCGICGGPGGPVCEPCREKMSRR